MGLLKSEIAPKGMEFNSADFVISGKYSTIMTVVSYPKTIGIGYLSDITSVSGVKAVVKHIPIAFSSMQKMHLLRFLNKNNCFLLCTED